jgi:hypothetical protein
MTVVRALVIAILFVVLPLSSWATQASCAFTTFHAPTGYTFSEVDGIGDDGTVVGQLENTTTLALVGFIHAPGGTTKIFTAPKSRMTFINGRNGFGANVGYYLDNSSVPHVHGFVLQGTVFTTLNHPNAANTWLLGINQLGTMAGSFSASSGTKGFLDTNGTYKTVAYSGATNTTAHAVNDNGVVVGSYSNSLVNHGFIWRSGTFTTVDYPLAKYGTVLSGINNSGLIVGNHISADKIFGFLYVNSTFKNIVYSGASYTTAGGINNNGLISGQIVLTNGASLGYTAVCR